MNVTPYHYALNTPINAIDINGDSTYVIFDGYAGKLYIYNDNNTLDDYQDDILEGTFDAHNNVTSSSNGKWEDGVYDVKDKEDTKKHPNEYEADGTTKQDSKNGRYGENGIFRVEDFDETTSTKTRTGMGIHAGRENKAFAQRKTLGCIRTTPEAIDAIQTSIDENGAFHTIVVRNNKSSSNSENAQKVNPGIHLAPLTVQQDNTRVILPAALYFNLQ